ncbi:MAG: hypothetical protein WBP81_18990 [Solirubrobacteraceae bacterium]
MLRLVPVSFVVAMLFIAPAATSASAQRTIPVKTTITIQAPFWAHSGRGVTFVGKVSGGPGCTIGRRVGLYQDADDGFGGGQIAPFVRTGSWKGHSQGYWAITVDAPGRQFTPRRGAAPMLLLAQAKRERAGASRRVRLPAPNATMTTLPSPTLGSTAGLSMWQVEMAAGAAGTPTRVRLRAALDRSAG